MAEGLEHTDDVSSWGTVVDATDVEAPIVFHFQPTKFVKVEEGKLQEWEQFFLKNVGFMPPKLAKANPWKGSPGGSVSGCASGWDDCDE